MKRYISAGIATTLIACMLLGCVSTPDIKYYTLDMAPTGNIQPAVNLVLDTLRASQALERRSILVKTSPTEIEYYATHEWAASVNELVAEKLRAEFGENREGVPTYLLSGAVQAFEQIDRPGDAPEAHVKLTLTIRPESASRYDTPALEKTYIAQLPVQGTGVRAVAEALSRCVEHIASEIARDTNAL